MERLDALMKLQQSISLRRNESLLDSNVRVLIDEVEDDYAIGRTAWDAPEIDQEVVVYSDKDIHVGSFITAHITAAAEYDLEAKLLQEEV